MGAEHDTNGRARAPPVRHHATQPHRPVGQRSGRLRSEIGMSLTLPNDKAATPQVPLSRADLGDLPSRLLLVSVEPARVINTKSEKR